MFVWVSARSCGERGFLWTPERPKICHLSSISVHGHWTTYKHVQCGTQRSMELFVSTLLYPQAWRVTLQVVTLWWADGVASLSVVPHLMRSWGPAGCLRNHSMMILWPCSRWKEGCVAMGCLLSPRAVCTLGAPGSLCAVGSEAWMHLWVR